MTSASVACGAHAGDPQTMRDTVARAHALGVVVGAHPGYEDREGFGRRELGWPAARIARSVTAQVAALGDGVAYVKPHGALYHRARADAEVAAVLRSLGLPVLGLDVAEGFCDRGYAPDGSLLPRDAPGALLGPEPAARQAVALAHSGRVASLCVHGDGDDPVGVAEAVRAALEAAGIELRPFAR